MNNNSNKKKMFNSYSFLMKFKMYFTQELLQVDGQLDLNTYDNNANKKGQYIRQTLRRF